MPVEPPPNRWIFPTPDQLDPADDLAAMGADLLPGTLLGAYRAGLFPMPVGGPRTPMAWFSPVRRGLLRPRHLRVTRSLRKSARRFEIRVDTALPEVIEACADPRRPSGWIDARVSSAYLELADLGWVHSVEAWRDGRLVGGLYGVAIGGLFAGESMFHRDTDASKVALWGLARMLDDGQDRLIDTQWQTPHLSSLGSEEWPRADYLNRLRVILKTPAVDFAGPVPAVGQGPAA